MFLSHIAASLSLSLPFPLFEINKHALHMDKKKPPKTEPGVEPKINICEIIIMHSSFYNCNAINLEIEAKRNYNSYMFAI